MKTLTLTVALALASFAQQPNYQNVLAALDAPPSAFPATPK